MRVLMIHPNWNTYSEVWLQRMMQYLENELVGIACFAPKEKKWNGIVPTMDLYGSKKKIVGRVLKKIPLLRTIKNKTIISEFTEFVKLTRPDVLFINFIGPAFYLQEALVKLKIPVLIHVHGVDVFWNAVNESTLQPVHPESYMNDVRNLLSNINSIHIIANSKVSLKYLLEAGIPEQFISLKYFGVPINLEQKKFHQNNLSVLYLGRFVDFKGPDIVVEAFIKACYIGFRGTLTMVGDGPLKQMCMVIARRSLFSERIFFMDPVDALGAAAYFREADIFTMHNCYGIISQQLEAFGVTIIEAMSHGTPVITGRMGGPEEIINHNGDGFLVTPCSIDEHANTFILLQEHPEILIEISEAARKKIATQFSEVLERENLFGILEGVISLNPNCRN